MAFMQQISGISMTYTLTAAGARFPVAQGAMAEPAQGGRYCFPVRSLREHTLLGFQRRGMRRWSHRTAGGQGRPVRSHGERTLRGFKGRRVRWRASRCVPCGNTPYTGSSGAGCDGGAAQAAGAAFRCVPCGNTPYAGSGSAGGWRSRPGGRCCFPVRSLREHTLRGFQQRGVGWQAARCVRRANAPYAGSGGAGAMVKPPRRGVTTAGN